MLKVVSVIFLTLCLIGCSAVTNRQADSSSPATLTIAGPSSVALGESASFTVSSAATSLQWSVNGVAGGSASLGYIQNSGLYVAPANMPSGSTVTISCTDPNGHTASQPVQLVNPLVIAGPSSVALGESASFTASYTAASLQWSVNGVAGGSASLGYIQNSGLYQAPANMPPGSTVTISCTDPNGQTGSQAIQLLNSLVIAGPPVVLLGKSASFSASSDATSLKWSVNGVVGGNTTLGYIQSNGMYEAPANMPSGGAVIISVSETNGETSSQVVNLRYDVPIISEATVMQYSPVAFLMSVTGTGLNSSSTLLLNGKPIPLTSASIGSASAQVMASALQIFPATVQISNPSPGGGASNIVQLDNSQTVPGTTVKSASRLLDQATFGPTMSDIQHVQTIGLQAYLDEQFSQPSSLVPPMPQYFNLGDCRPSYQCFTDGWWFRHAMWGPDQLRQKVAFALSEQWVVSYVQVHPAYFPALLNIFANDAFGNWRTLMQDVTLSPAMGTFLDMVNSQKPSSTTEADQNYAREFMQLFNLGPDKLNQDGTLQLDGSGNVIPEYSPDQIDALSRAFTGWTYGSLTWAQPCTSAAAFIEYNLNTLPGANCPMTPVEAMHDTDEKILLDGVTLPSGQSAEDDLKQALDDIFNDSNLPPFVSKQLIQHLVKSTPSPAYVERVANVFVDNGSGVRGDLKAVITAILLDPEARADDVPGQISEDGGKLREPLLWMLSQLRSVNAKDVSPDMLGQYYAIINPIALIGEAVHDPANVFGYFSPNYLIPGTDINAPEFQLESSFSYPLEQGLAQSMVGGSLGSAVSIDWSTNGQLGQLAAADPELLIEYLNIVMLHGEMPDQMRSSLLSTIQGEKPDAMAKLAVFLISTSPQYKVMN